MSVGSGPALRSIGHHMVGAVGFGAAGLSVANPPPEGTAVEVVVAALEAGVTLLDSAACYVPSHRAPGHNEALLAKALASWGGGRDRVLVATKGGIVRVRDQGGWDDFETCGRPECIKAHCEISLRALGAERIGLYQLHSPDPKVPIEETMGAFAELQAAGKVDLVGVSNVSVAELDRARSVVGIASVQNRFSPLHRDHAEVVAACEERGIAFLAYSPLGGLGKGGGIGAKCTSVAQVAGERGVSPQQVALAWELACSPALIPIPGSRRVETARDSAAAASLQLSPGEIARISSEGGPK